MAVLCFFTIHDFVLNTKTHYRAFSLDVTAAMFVFQNEGMAAMMMYQTD